MSNPSLLGVLRKRDPKTHVRAASFTSNNVPWRTASYSLITLWCSQALPSRRTVARRLTTVHCPWWRPLRRCRARLLCWLPPLILKQPNVYSRPSRRVSIKFLDLFRYFLVFWRWWSTCLRRDCSLCKYGQLVCPICNVRRL